MKKLRKRGVQFQTLKPLYFLKEEHLLFLLIFFFIFFFLLIFFFFNFYFLNYFFFSFLIFKMIFFYLLKCLDVLIWLQWKSPFSKSNKTNLLSFFHTLYTNPFFQIQIMIQPDYYLFFLLYRSCGYKFWYLCFIQKW